MAPAQTRAMRRPTRTVSRYRTQRKKRRLREGRGAGVVISAFIVLPSELRNVMAITLSQTSDGSLRQSAPATWLIQIPRIRNAKPASAPPVSGPRTGMGAYRQSDPPFPAIGRIACVRRGPKSRAGFIAYPVVPPRESPTPHTRLATRYGPRPLASPPAATALEKIAPTTNTRTNVAMISLKRLGSALRIAGP